MTRVEAWLGMLVAAVLGSAAMALAPPMTVTYSLWGSGGTEYQWLPGLPILLSLLAVAGLLARAMFEVSPWLLGPSTVLGLAAWWVTAAFVGEDAPDYRAAWFKTLVLVVVAAIPGTVGACAGELAFRWRRSRSGSGWRP